MLRTISIYGLIAGLIVAVPMNILMLLFPHGEGVSAYLSGYTLMLVGLSFIFVAVKRYRDRALGGVIKFLPAFLIGLGISVVAGIIYVIAWEISLAMTNYTFMNDYVAAAIAAERAKGLPSAQLNAFIAEMEQMKTMYANPLFRLPMTFIEIFPVGLIVSLIAALLLRNSRFLPARSAIA
ncbi:MAG: DUF4199 domain-containing protein [Terricaulis sp.]